MPTQVKKKCTPPRIAEKQEIKGLLKPTKKAEKAELQRYKEHAYKNTLYRVYKLVKKQLASYQTTVNGDNPHYHFFEIDSEGNGTTHGTINTGIDMQESDPHDHNIKKWVVSSAKKHIHAIDVVMKAGKRGRPKKVRCKAPSQAMFKNFEEYHKSMKKYFKKPTRRPMAKGTHLTKSYLEKVMNRVLKMMTEKAKPKPVGSISERAGGRYKKVAPGKWAKVKEEPEGKPEEELPEFDLPEKREEEEGGDLKSNIISEIENIDQESQDRIVNTLEDLEKPDVGADDAVGIIDGLLGDIDEGKLPGITVDSPVNGMLLDLWEKYSKAS